MNGTKHDGFDQVLLDRLVDGEIPEAEYHELLIALESQPGGWRQCAVAFLEAQAWGRVIRSLPPEPGGRVAPCSKRQPSRAWLQAGWLLMACACSFLLTAYFADRLFFRPPAEPAKTDLAVEQPMQDQYGESQPPPLRHAPLGHYRLVSDGGSEPPQVVEMPVFAADDPRAGVLFDENATTPRELIRVLERSGHQVRRERNWIPVPGNSGPFYVPMDDLQITPVSGRAFQ